jgi:SAM-dependent methyltransferase
MRPYLRAGMAVADLGCGHGGLLRELRLIDSTLKLSAIDLSPVRVNNARARVPDAEVRVGDIEALPFADAAFEAAFATEVMEHLPDPVKALREIRRVLKRNSWLLVSLPNRDWFHFEDYQDNRLRFQPVDDRFYRVAEFEGFLREAGFKVHKVRGGENLYFGGGFPRLLERVALLVYPALHRRMKRMIFVTQKVD